MTLQQSAVLPAMSARINTCVYFCNLMLDIQQHPVVYVIDVSVAVCYPAPNKNCHRCKALAASPYSGVDQCILTNVPRSCSLKQTSPECFR